MGIEELKIILANKLSTLNAQKTHFIQVGDIEQIIIIEAKIVETETTISLLNTLVS